MKKDIRFDRVIEHPRMGNKKMKLKQWYVCVWEEPLHPEAVTPCFVVGAETEEIARKQGIEGFKAKHPNIPNCKVIKVRALGLQEAERLMKS